MREIAGAVFAAGLLAGTAANAQGAGPDSAFTLGRIEEVVVTASPLAAAGIGSSTLTAEQIQTFDRVTVSDALALVPGAVASNTGGPRNEQLIFVRGFDRFQVPISIDGIRIYLPADNRLDFGRFLTDDLAEIQILKGYVSVLNGPGALGGAINLVTRKPTRPFEVEASTGLTFDNDLGNSGYNASGLIGSRQDKYYVEASGAITRREYFGLSDDFTPTVNEDGGKRENSASHDWRVNLKAGYTPNATDEYALSYTSQHGAKGAPFHVTDPVSSQRDWTWPYWDLQNIYFLSNTALGTSSNLKTSVYYNTFKNGLFSYDNATFSTQSLPKAFRSYYDDWAYGGSVQFSTALAASDTFGIAAHYRRDNHVEWQDLYAPVQTEPKQTDTEDTYSLAVENTFHASAVWDVTVGASEDWRHLIRANDWTRTVANTPAPPHVTASSFVYYPLGDSDAFNWQAKTVYRLEDDATLHASVSARSRFPTIFERFSTQFGGATSNPDLGPERAIATEIGYSSDIFRNVHVDGTLFYNDLDDAIESVKVSAVPYGGAAGTFVSQSQNVGDGRSFGAELSFTATVADDIQVGGNYTYIDRKITDPNIAIFRATGVPAHKAFLFATATLGALAITPSLEFASNRWTSNTPGSLYYKTGASTLANLGVSYAIDEYFTVDASARNIFDVNYQLFDGFPEQGRNFSLTLRAAY